MARAAFAPIDLSLPTKRVSAMLAQVRPSCIIIADGCCHDDLVRSGIQGVDGLTPPPSIIGAGELLSAVRGAREDESGDPWLEEEGVGGVEDDGDVGDDTEGGGKCWVYFTSGTSGAPKGVVCCHDAASNYCQFHPLLPRASERGQHVRVLLASAFTFDPSAGDAFSALAYGCVLCVAPRRQGMLADMQAALTMSRATHVCSTPAVWTRVKWCVGMEGLQVVGLGGEKMSEAIVAEWAQRVRLYNVWGTTEGTVYQTVGLVSEPGGCSILGEAVEGVLIRIEGEGGEEVGEGEEGEVVIGGVQIGLGYLGDVRGGFEKRGGERWYRTGDLAVKFGGSIKLIGRRDAQVKVNGERVELQEVEGVLMRCPLVEAAAARPSRNGRTLDAFLLLTSEGRACQEAAVAAADAEARTSLSRGWCPSTYTLVEGKMPTTASGKLDRPSLQEPAHGQGSDAAAARPMTGRSASDSIRIFIFCRREAGTCTCSHSDLSSKFQLSRAAPRGPYEFIYGQRSWRNGEGELWHLWVVRSSLWVLVMS